MTRPALSTRFLFGVAVLAWVASCGGSEPTAPTATGASAPGASESRPVSAGAAVYSTGALMCALCHGQAGAGTMMGPSLDGLAADWNEADLAAFLKDPVAWLPKSARLNEIHSRYPQGMPQPKGLDDADAALLARWLIADRPK